MRIPEVFIASFRVKGKTTELMVVDDATNGAEAVDIIKRFLETKRGFDVEISSMNTLRASKTLPGKAGTKVVVDCIILTATHLSLIE